MTHEEAINTLKDILEEVTETDDSVCYVTSDDTDTLKAAIKALEIQPCEDCISRAYIESIVEELENICINGDEHILLLLSNIKNAPSVTPSRPKGHWILIHPLQEDDDGAYICSNCEHGDWDCDNSYKYCPFCGADMRESEDKE